VPVYAFSLIIGLGAIIGLAWITWLNPPVSNGLRIFNTGLWVLVGALAGGRAGFVLANWPYFQSNPGEALQIYQGGLAWPGAIAGGLLFLGLYALASRQSLGLLADGLLPLVVAITVSAWLGCWVDGCAYGPTVSSWWGIPARDEAGNLASRWPTQLIGALLTLGLFWLLDQRWFPNASLNARPGRVASLALLGLALHLLALSFMRVDPALVWGGLRIDAWAALALATSAALALFGLYWREIWRR
jgi:phosphatidylglycerol:prolipoprotein diacylglycerol transferase